MAAPYFWLYNGTDTLDLGSSCREIELGGNKRNYDFIDFATSHGAVVRGVGNYSNKQFKISHIEYVEGADVHAYNSRYDDFMAFFTNRVFDDLWLRRKNGEETRTEQIPVYPTKWGGLKLNNYRITDNREILLESNKAYFENITATTGNETISSAIEHTFTITNNGNVEVDAIFSFTPDTLADKFQVRTSEGFAWRLEGDFALGQAIIFNQNNGVMTLGGATVDVANYLTWGTTFPLKKGSNTVYVLCSTTGSFDYSFYERYI